MPVDVAGYLSEQQRKWESAGNQELAHEFAVLDELYNKKLWHQLTLCVGQLVKRPALAQGDSLVKLYHNFVADFEQRINPLALVEIVLVVTQHIRDPKEALELLEKIRERVKISDEASVLCMTAMGVIKLRENDLDGTKAIIKQAQEVLDTLDGVTTVHGRFYDLSSNYYRQIGNHTDYYRDALRFLGCMDQAEIPQAQQAERALNLCLAAILGKDVYNFGELLAHPILQALAGGEKQWLVDLVFAFNSGNLGRFDQLRTHWQAQPDLAMHSVQMQQKISLLCLMEMTFKRPATDRQLTFTEIAAETHLPIDEVELLVMKALSLGLVRGSIDEVERRVHMTWVQPRVLDRDQIATMRNKMEQWYKDVIDMERLVEIKAQDILT